MHPIEQALFALIKANQFDDVKRQLETEAFAPVAEKIGPTLLCADKQGHTVLHMALMAKDARILNIVYEYLQKYNQSQQIFSRTNIFSLTLMQCAVVHANVEGLVLFFRICAEQKINIQEELKKPLLLGDERQLTPVQLCVSRRDASILLVLLGYNQAEIEQWQREHASVVIDNKTRLDLTQLDSNENSLSHLAARAGQIEQLQILCQLTDDQHLEMQNQRHETVLLSAMHAERPQACMRYLFDRGVNTDVHDVSGYSVVHLAAIHPDMSVLELVIEKRLPLFDPNLTAKQPLELAAKLGYANHIHRLLQSGAGINAEIGLLILKLIREQRLDPSKYILINAKFQGPVLSGVRKVAEFKDFNFESAIIKECVTAQIRYRLERAHGMAKENLSAALRALTPSNSYALNVLPLEQEPISAVAVHSPAPAELPSNIYLITLEEILAGISAKLGEFDKKYNASAAFPITLCVVASTYTFLLGLYIFFTGIISLSATVDTNNSYLPLNGTVLSIISPWKCANTSEEFTRNPEFPYQMVTHITYSNCSMNFSGTALWIGGFLISVLLFGYLIYKYCCASLKDPSAFFLSVIDKNMRKDLDAWLKLEMARLQQTGPEYTDQKSKFEALKSRFASIERVSHYRAALWQLNDYLRINIFQELQKRQPKFLMQHDLKPLTQLFNPVEEIMDEKSGMAMSLLSKKPTTYGSMNVV